MAKVALINRDEKRRKLVEKYAAKRAELQAIARDVNRSDEAIGTGATKIAVGCPFCNVMLNDGTTQRKQEGAASEDIEVLDVAALLLDSVKE